MKVIIEHKKNPIMKNIFKLIINSKLIENKVETNLEKIKHYHFFHSLLNKLSKNRKTIKINHFFGLIN
jgi:hypothetical protein